MLFNHGTDIFESEKERNLYYKFFAGYYFNELVPGYGKRVKSFYELLFQQGIDKKDSFGDFALHEGMKIPSAVHVTLDFHGYLLAGANDKGELADILIQDQQNKLFIAVEAKFLKNWDYKKDIMINSDRIMQLEKHSRALYQALLLTDEKLRNCIKKENQSNSNWSKLINKDEPWVIPLRVITWQSLFDICLNNNGDSHKVIEYFQAHISKKKEEFRVSS